MPRAPGAALRSKVTGPTVVLPCVCNDRIGDARERPEPAGAVAHRMDCAARHRCRSGRQRCRRQVVGSWRSRWRTRDASRLRAHRLNMILHGFSLAPVARRLKLTINAAPTVAIVDATPWTETLAKTLRMAGTPVLLIDTFAGMLDVTRSKGIPVRAGGTALLDRGWRACASAASTICSPRDAERHPQQPRLLQAGLRNSDAERSTNWPQRGSRSSSVPRSTRSGADRWSACHRRASRTSPVRDTRPPARSFSRSSRWTRTIGDDKMALLIVRPNGDLVFVSAEMPKVDLVEGDRVLRALQA